ncbi:MAG: holo-ACP synthase [Ilumatobacteraceae bacterium]
MAASATPALPAGPVRGHGIDVVDIDHFRRALQRTPTMRERLFTVDELADLEGAADPVPSLAVRFAAREAVMKAMGLGLGAFGFHEVWVRRQPSGAPILHVAGRALELAVERGIGDWHLSLSHTRLVAVASVIATA